MLKITGPSETSLWCSFYILIMMYLPPYYTHIGLRAMLYISVQRILNTYYFLLSRSWRCNVIIVVVLCFGETVMVFVKYTVVQSQIICITLRGNDLLLYENSSYRYSLSIGKEGKSHVQMDSLSIPGAEH